MLLFAYPTTVGSRYGIVSRNTREKATRTIEGHPVSSPVRTGIYQQPLLEHAAPHPLDNSCPVASDIKAMSKELPLMLNAAQLVVNNID